MCLLEGVLEWNDDFVLCISRTHLDPANPLRRQGRLSALHAFEYGAQAAAVHGGLRARAAGKSAPPGYLAAIREGHLNVELLDDVGTPLLVRAQRLFGEGADTVYQCEISAGAELLVSGRVTIMLRT